MRYVIATIAGIIVVGIAYIGWTWFYETKSISNGVEEQSVMTEVSSDSASSTTPQKEVSLKVFQSEWLKRNGNNVCGEIDETPMGELLQMIEKKTPGYTISTTTPYIQEELPLYWFFDPEICGYTTTLEWEDEEVGYEWYKGAQTVLNSRGWKSGKNQLMDIGGREFEFVPISGGRALSNISAFIHIPTVTAPYLQFLRVSESQKVSGFDELEGFYCPCSYIVSLTLSEMYPMHTLESFVAGVQTGVVAE